MSQSNPDLQKLTKIKELIRQRQFEEARRALQTMPQNPVARDWLAKLDKTAPPKPDMGVTDEFYFPPRSAQAATPEPRHATNPQVMPSVADPIYPHDPWKLGVANSNTSIGFVTGGLFGGLALMIVGYTFRLGDNWNSFGKPKWANISFVLSALGIIASLAALIIPVLLITSIATENGPNNWLMAICGGWGGIFSFNIALLVAQLHIQQKAYRAWQRNKQAFADYVYDFDMGLIWGTVIIAIGTLLGTGVGYALVNSNGLSLPTGSYETPYFTITYTSGWRITENPNADACSNYSMECFLQLNSFTGSAPVSGVFFHYDVDQTLTLDYLDGHHWNRISNSNGVFHPQRRLPVTINGQQWVGHEYTFVRTDGSLGYIMSVYFSFENHAIQIDFFTNTVDDLNANRDKITELLASIQY